ncbi:Methionyl-tRNA formyltransferase [hydrothermal vent metagenome]|uniref:Methionyl-tRNA formyltransferase n=1 Tax=hydrothermal vent metagenome TaxID=652676 RepID=A0A3B0XIJ4_9ZZZZ
MLMKNKIRNGLIIIVMSLLSACGTSPKTNFYILNIDRDLSQQKSEGVSIGVWKVTLPNLIDRPEIITRTGSHTINLADFHRWAGGLKSNISFLLANELSYHLKTGHVDISPWSSYRNFDFQIKVHVRKFTGELGGLSEFEGAYIILNGKGDKKVLEKTFSFSEKVNSKKYTDIALAMSKLVSSLSREISNSVQEQIKIK